MNKLQSLVLAITLLVGSVSVATAQDYDKGVAAYNAGDYLTALSELTPLAQKDDAAARYTLGMMYLSGEGVREDNLEALQLLRLSAEQEYAPAQGQLGYMYYVGIVVTEDPFKALEWLRLGAKNGNLISQSTLGNIYQSKENYVESAKWYRLAAKQADATSQLSLAVYYYRPHDGVPQDFMQAYMWFSISSYLGNTLASMFLNPISRDMPSVDISKAQELARECMSSNYQNCGGY